MYLIFVRVMYLLLPKIRDSLSYNEIGKGKDQVKVVDFVVINKNLYTVVILSSFLCSQSSLFRNCLFIFMQYREANQRLQHFYIYYLQCSPKHKKCCNKMTLISNNLSIKLLKKKLFN